MSLKTAVISVLVFFAVASSIVVIPASERAGVFTWMLFVCMVAGVGAAIFSVVVSDERVRVAERIFESYDELHPAVLLAFQESAYRAKRQLLIAMLLTLAFSAGFSMGFILPEQSISEMGLTVSGVNLNLTTRNTGVLVMAASLAIAGATGIINSFAPKFGKGWAQGREAHSASGPSKASFDPVNHQPEIGI